jgi:leader peptidase (prepilin peptidase)/N-methyltransferase
MRQISAAPLTGPVGLAMGVGGVVMLAMANLLLRLKWLPRSFEMSDQPGDTSDLPHDHDTPAGPEDWPVHPHPRRESLKELLFLVMPIGGAAVGYLVIRVGGLGDTSLPGWAAALGGVLLGYLGGGAVVWATRVLGTLAFGKEAMGLGDVHLMAAVGAVCGWRVAVLAFFIAPFFGLAYALVANGLAKLLKREVKMIPYGPHLAVATVIVCIAYQPLLDRFAVLLGS